MELDRVFGYRAEIVLYDDHGRALFVSDALRCEGTPMRVVLNDAQVSRALSEARGRRAFDPRPNVIASDGDGWRVR